MIERCLTRLSASVEDRVSSLTPCVTVKTGRGVKLEAAGRGRVVNHTVHTYRMGRNNDTRDYHESRLCNLHVTVRALRVGTAVGQKHHAEHQSHLHCYSPFIHRADS